jgi:hypothetical protein
MTKPYIRLVPVITVIVMIIGIMGMVNSSIDYLFTEIRNNHLFEKYKDNAHYKAELKRKIDDDKVEYLDLEKMSADQLKERREEEKSQKLALLKYQQVLTFFQYLIAFVVGIIFYRKFSE